MQAKRDVHYVSGPPPGVCDAQELHWVIRSSTDLQVFRSSGYIAFRSSGSDRVRFPPETYSLAVRCSSTARSLLTDYSSFPTWPIAPSRCGQILAAGGRSADSSVLWKVVNVRRVPSSRPPRRQFAARSSAGGCRPSVRPPGMPTSTGAVFQKVGQTLATRFLYYL